MNDSQYGNSTNALFINFSVEFVVVCSIIYAFIIIASLLGNITVCVVILSTRSLRRSINTCFILSLAVSDLTTTGLVMPFDLEQIISGYKWGYGEIMCNVWTTAYLLTVPTSILTLLALSVYRYRTLKDPLDRFKESPLMTCRRALLIVCILWAYSMLFSLAPVLGWKEYPKSVYLGACYFNITVTYSVGSSVVNFLLPVLAACLINCRMYYFVRKLSRNSLQQGERSGESQPIPCNATARNNLSTQREDKEEPRNAKPMDLCFNSPPTEQPRRNGLNRFQNAENETTPVSKLEQKRNTRAAKTTFLIVFAFVFCWLPYTLLSITENFYNEFARQERVPRQVLTFLLMMGYLNSAINPILYSFRIPKFKKAIKEMIGNKRHLPRRENWMKTRRAWRSDAKSLPDVLCFDNLGVTLKSCNVNLEVRETKF
ncbi:alpha-1A adrenergic receptor-like [Oculina patagonica]